MLTKSRIGFSERKFLLAKRAIQKELRVMKSFSERLWGASSAVGGAYTIYKSGNGAEWLLEGKNPSGGREALIVEVVSSARFAEIFGADEFYEPRVFVHWHERRYMPVRLKTLDKKGLAEGLVDSVKRGGPFPVSHFFYADWLKRS